VRTIKILLAAVVLLQLVELVMMWHGLYVYSCEPSDDDDTEELPTGVIES
jgi:hypothetical protein